MKNEENRVRQFLSDVYSDTSLAPTKEQFENEVIDIVEECERLGGFDNWLKRFKEEQYFAK